MPRLDVYPMPGRREGYVLDVQANLLDHLATRTVVPLLPAKAAPPPIRDLNPVFDIGGTSYVLLTQAIATIPTRELRLPIASLAEARDQFLPITSAARHRLTALTALTTLTTLATTCQGQTLALLRRG